MNYYVARSGQTYGPYSEETMRKYMREGSMLATDMACSDAAPTWVQLGQLLGGSAAAPPQPSAAPPPVSAAPVYTPPVQTPPVYTPPAASEYHPAQPPVYTPPVYTPPAYNQQAGYQPPYAQPQQMMGQGMPGANIPPSLHWALILLIAAFTGGLFITIWVFIQANWIKSINPQSKAIRDLILGIFLPVIGVIVLVVMMVTAGIAAGGFDHMTAAAAGSMVVGGLSMMAFGTVGLIFHIKAFFGMRDSMQRYYNSTEPINLRLSAVMTFFFNTLYFQYHMSRIADWKRTGVLRP